MRLDSASLNATIIICSVTELTHIIIIIYRLLVYIIVVFRDWNSLIVTIKLMVNPSASSHFDCIYTMIRFGVLLKVMVQLLCGTYYPECGSFLPRCLQKSVYIYVVYVTLYNSNRTSWTKRNDPAGLLGVVDAI